MSFKTKKEINSKENKEHTKEKNYLITQIETIENSSLPFAFPHFAGGICIQLDVPASHWIPGFQPANANWYALRTTS